MGKKKYLSKNIEMENSSKKPSKLKNHFENLIFFKNKITLSLKNKFNRWGKDMIGPIEKGFEKAKLELPPQGVYEDVDLKVLPKYISYKAALLKEKLTLKYVLGIVIVLFSVQFLSSKLEISRLHKNLREKEYILAPGVLDFTTASPQSIPDGYVDDASMEFISLLGNVNKTTIVEQYKILKRFMSRELQIKFEMEVSSWMDQVKTEDISQTISILEKEIISNQKGAYKVTAIMKADFYANHQYLGHEDQVIEMVLTLTPPESGKRWYLQITTLSWSKAETYKTKSNLSKGEK